MPRLIALLVCLVLGSAPIVAWHTDGHEMVVIDAVELLEGSSIPAFFVAESRLIGDFSVEPDVMKLRSVPQLRAQESPEHYLDYEYVAGHELPEDRWDFIELCRTLGEEPKYVGMLPYTITEWTQRLALAFAQYRAEPDGPYHREKILFYAGILSHYATDVAQPLHTTIHFNGRVGDDGRSPRTGIHNLVDALFGELDLGGTPAGELGEPAPFDDLWGGVMAQFHESHGLVDRIYELEPQLAAPADHPEVVELAKHRYRTAARFLASLYLTAWEMSASIELPDWLIGPAD